MELSFKDQESVVAKESLRFAAHPQSYSETESHPGPVIHQATSDNGGNDVWCDGGEMRDKFRCSSLSIQRN